MKRYIGLHVVSIILTILATVLCGIMVVDFLTASEGLEQAASLTVGIIFAMFGAGAYLVAMIFGAIGWGLTRRLGRTNALFVVETLLPIVLAVAVFLIYLI